MQQERPLILIIRKLAPFVVALILIWVFWLILRTPFVTVVIPEGSTGARITQGNGPYKRIIESETRLRLKPGEYLVTFFKDERPTHMNLRTVGSWPWQSIKATNSSKSRPLTVATHRQTSKAVPFADGYIYINKQTRGIEFANGSRLIDMSSKFELATTPFQSDNPARSTVINIEPATDGGVVVTTTTTAFVVRDLDTIVRLPSYDKDFLNFTSSSYDNVSNRLFLLSSYNRKVFYYDLSNLNQGIKVFHEHNLDINRVTAGGGHLAIYFDNIPSLDPGVLDSYRRTRQLAPVVFTATNKENESILNRYEGVTQLAFSKDSRYLMVKRKFETTATISDPKGGNSLTIPAADGNGFAWDGDSFVFGREKSLWRAQPETGFDPELIGNANALIDYIVVRSGSIYASTPEGTSFMTGNLAPGSSSKTALQSVIKKGLAAEGYAVSLIIDRGANILAIVETQGKFVTGADELDYSEQPIHLSTALQLIEPLRNHNLAILEKDTSLIIPYTYAGPPFHTD